MFQNITNSDLKGALQALKSYFDRRMFLFGMFVFFFLAALVVGGAKVYNLSTRRSTQMGVEVESLKNSISNGGQSVEITPVPVEIPVKTTVVNAAVEIGYTGYNPLWDYLEYGDTVEYFHPETPKATLWFEYGDVAYVAVLSLDPAHYRALMAKFPDYVTYLKSGYRVIAEVSGDKVISVDRIVDSLGNLVWTPSMVKAPRELNPLEKWSLWYASEGYEFLVKEWFDTLPDCTDCVGVEWSPAEQYARAEAFFRYVYEPDNDLWVEIWGSVDATYRWIDAETGAALGRVDPGADLWSLPASGWLGLQVCPLGKGPCSNPEDWETTYKIKVSPGFVVGIDQIGNVFESGQAGWVFSGSEEAPAKRTRDWTIEKLIELLGD